MKWITYLTLALCSFGAVAEQKEQARPWLEQLSSSLQERNFSTSFVVVKNNKTEPYHWAHGLNNDGDELELLSLLNGPRRDVLRKNNIVSYIEPDMPAYSVNSQQINSPIPAIFSGDIDRLLESYNVVSVGRNRILGRTAQLIRVEPHDKYRHSYWLWLDKESGLLLKLAVLNAKSQILEQIQFTHLEYDKKLAKNLQQLDNTELPKVINLPENEGNIEQVWQVTWMPKGFNEISANRHRITRTKQAVEFKMISDGLVDVSIYVNRNEQPQRAFGYVLNGATIVTNQIKNNIEISVVGKIPSLTAKAIADSIVFKQGNDS